MSWRDRDYRGADDGAISWTLKRPPPATLVLLLLHVGGFVLGLVLAGPMQPGPFDVARLGPAPHPVAILLHPFVTQNILSIAITVWALWSLGGRLEREHGPRRMLALYAVGTVCAGAGYFVVTRARAALAEVPLDWPAGAVAAFCFLTWLQHRYAPVQLLGRDTTVGGVYGIAAAVIVTLTLALNGLGALAWLTGLLAAVAGAALLERLSPTGSTAWTSSWEPPAGRSTWSSGVWGRRWRNWWRSVHSSRRSPPRPAIPDENEVDAILAKISRDGLDSLTPRERARLEAARQARLRQSSR